MHVNNDCKTLKELRKRNRRSLRRDIVITFLTKKELVTRFNAANFPSYFALEEMRLSSEAIVTSKRTIV